MDIRNKWLWLGFGGIALLTTVVYAQIVTHGFVSWDDYALIVENPIIRGLTWQNFQAAFTSYDPELYVPLTTLSYQLNYAIAGLSPWMYHATNLLLHLLNIVLVGWVALKLSNKHWIALICALLFALHPINVETVAWASARKDLLSGFFFLLSILCYLQNSRFRIQNSWRWYAVSLIAFAAGLLSKVSIVPLPLILLLLDWRAGEKLTLRGLGRYVPFAALTFVFLSIGFAGKVTESAFLGDQLLIGARSVLLYISKLFIPMHLSPFYPYTKAISILTPDILASVLLVLALTGLCVWALKKSREPLFAWLWFLLLIAPSIGNMARGHNELLDVYIGSDRYAYLAALGIFWLVAFSFEMLRTRWPKPSLGLLGIVTVLLGVLSYRQAMTWKDSESLFRHAVEASPNSYVAHTNLGTILVQQGDIEGGVEEYQTALRIRDDATTYYNLGLIYEAQGQIDEAIASYRWAVHASPLEQDAWRRLGELLIERGLTAEGQKALEEANGL